MMLLSNSASLSRCLLLLWVYSFMHLSRTQVVSSLSAAFDLASNPLGNEDSTKRSFEFDMNCGNLDRDPAIVIVGLTGFAMGKNGFQIEMSLKSSDYAKCTVTVSAESGTAISHLNMVVLAIRDNPGKLMA